MKCRDCGSTQELVQDKKDNAILCIRCFLYRILNEEASIGFAEAKELLGLLQAHYPNDINKQKNLMMAIFEGIEAGEPTTTPNGQKTISITETKLLEIARKWQVEDAILLEILKVKLRN